MAGGAHGLRFSSRLSGALWDQPGCPNATCFGIGLATEMALLRLHRASMEVTPKFKLI